ncbi:MAG: ketol-acid reductoisomerase, partial [Pseudomonadota bacterium]|nr:ketol-acid reductoisomerase [Pseudomonadota bacterium]
QGHAQALNLNDSGIDVVVGIRDGSPSTDRAASDGIATASLAEAAASARIVMLLAPDETLPAIYRQIEPHLRQGVALGFSHGFAIRFDQIVPRADLDVFMVAPKGPGSALRSLYVAGQGMTALYAVAQDASGGTEALALAYGRAIGCGRAGLMPTSFAEECDADLFNEAAVVWGAVPDILIAGFDVLVEAGISEEIAFMECVGELKLLADLIETRGIAAMRSAISNTAELGGVTGGPRIIDDRVRTEMRQILAGIRDGSFAAMLSAEAASGYPLLRSAREKSAALPVERARTRLRRVLGD